MYGSKLINYYPLQYETCVKYQNNSHIVSSNGEIASKCKLIERVLLKWKSMTHTAIIKTSSQTRWISCLLFDIFIANKQAIKMLTDYTTIKMLTDYTSAKIKCRYTN